jgi:hypothetical protein
MLHNPPIPLKTVQIEKKVDERQVADALHPIYIYL